MSEVYEYMLIELDGIQYNIYIEYFDEDFFVYTFFDSDSDEEIVFYNEYIDYLDEDEILSSCSDLYRLTKRSTKIQPNDILDVITKYTNEETANRYKEEYDIDKLISTRELFFRVNKLIEGKDRHEKLLLKRKLFKLLNTSDYYE